MVATEQPEVDPVAKLGPGVHPVAVVGNTSAGVTRLEIQLKRVGVDLQIASYQAELSFANGSFVRAELPEGVTGSWNEARPGTLRFVGAALDGVGDGAVLVAYVTSAGGVRASDLRIKVEELTSTAGFKDVTGLVATAAHPPVVRSALR